MKIRVVKTASNAKAVQVVRYQNNRRVVMHHVGSAHSQESLDDLISMAEQWIEEYSGQLSIFPDESPNKLLSVNHCTFLGVQYNFFYDQINSLQSKIGLGDLPVLLKDLV